MAAKLHALTDDHFDAFWLLDVTDSDRPTKGHKRQPNLVSSFPVYSAL